MDDKEIECLFCERLVAGIWFCVLLIFAGSTVKIYNHMMEDFWNYNYANTITLFGIFLFFIGVCMFLVAGTYMQAAKGDPKRW